MLQSPSAPASSERSVYLDADQPIETRLDDLLPRLTLNEKIALVHGDTQFTIPGVPRLGIPRFSFSDGPHGVREEISSKSWEAAGRTDDFATYLPVGIALAATWNPALAHSFGRTIADEARQRGKDMMLGPGVNIMRSPLNGRNFEYFGEDPWLSGQIAAADIMGLQDGDVAACVKHFALNNQETDRFNLNVEVDERTLREIYLPAFEAAVKQGRVRGVMGAYNRLRGQFCCHNDHLLNEILKKEWGFSGIVVSDWGGAHDTGEAAMFGLDVEMGTTGPFDEFYLARPLRVEIEEGRIPLAALDDKVRRILRVQFAGTGVAPRKEGSINTAAHQKVALEVAEESLVLLKNIAYTLPLELGGIRSIAVIGENAVRRHGHSGHSSEVKALYEITPLEGIVARVGMAANVTFSQGYRSPLRERANEYGVGGVAKSQVVQQRNLGTEDLIDRAVTAAREAEVALVFAGLSHDDNFDTEGSDRKNLRLPYRQDELIARVVAANPRTVVVLYSGGPVEMDPWLDRVPAVLHAWYPGMEGGVAISHVLFGDVNPSGKLPCSFPRRLADSAAHHAGNADSYPGVAGSVLYAEGLFVGYRWHDAKRIEPLFPFGFGLSYTAFELSKANLMADGDNLIVACEVTNTGYCAGAEVVQVYVEPRNPSVERPLRELKAFQKVALNPGETRMVSVILTPRAFAYYSTEQKSWVAESGEYVIRIGTSSRDLPLHQIWIKRETVRVV
jgi:beta-glucosidase